MELEQFEKKIFSQNCEDGITMKLVELIYDEPKNNFFVEFGVENGCECNTRILREKYGWNGLQMDGGYENSSINLRREFITRENIVNLFTKYNVPHNINLLSVDIDFNDFYCLKEILEKYTCDIIICEYNSSHLPHEDKVIIYDGIWRWDGTNYFGASLLAFSKLGQKYGYTLVYCDKTGVNCFFVNNKIIASKNLHFNNMGDVAKIYKPPNYTYGRRTGHRQDPFYRRYIPFELACKI